MHRLKELSTVAAYNFAIQQCKAKYVAFLKPNDEWLPVKLWQQYLHHEKHNDVVMSFTNYAHISKKDDLFIADFDLCPQFKEHSLGVMDYAVLDNAALVLSCENIINTSTVLINKNALQNANGFKLNDDGSDLWLRLANMGSVAFTTNVGSIHLIKQDVKSRNNYLKLLKLNYILAKQTKRREMNYDTSLFEPNALLNNACLNYCVEVGGLFIELSKKIKSLNQVISNKELKHLIDSELSLIK